MSTNEDGKNKIIISDANIITNGKKNFRVCF